MTAPRWPDLALGHEWAALELLAVDRASPGAAEHLGDLLRSPQLDLGELLEQAMRHRLVHRLAHHLERDELEDAIGYEVRQHLATLLRANRHRTVLLRGEAARVAYAFRTHGVRVACTKGIVFEAALYGANGTRPMNDIDLMISPQERSAVTPIMAELGFQPGYYNPKTGSVELDRRTELLYKLHPDHLPHYTRVIDDPIVPYLVVDVANSFTWTNSPWQIPMPICLDRLGSHPVPGTKADLPCLAPAFQFLFTILHLFRDAWFERNARFGKDVDLQKFSDVLHCYEAWRTEIVAGDFLGIVDEWGLQDPVLWVLAHLDRSLHTAILAELGRQGLASEAWLASAQSPAGGRVQWRGTMRERLQSKERPKLFW
jgi:hypothetical protein